MTGVFRGDREWWLVGFRGAALLDRALGGFVVGPGAAESGESRVDTTARRAARLHDCALVWRRRRAYDLRGTRTVDLAVARQ